MIRRNTLVLFVVFLVLLGGILYINQDSHLQVSLGMATATPTELPKIVTGFSVSNLAGVSVQSQKGNNVQIVQSAKGDWITAKNEPVNITTMFQVVQNLVELTISGIPDSSTTLNAVGLDSPQTKIILTDSQGTQSALLIGNQSPTNSGYYVKWKDNPIYLVSSDQIDSLVNLFAPESILSPTPTPQTTGSPQTPSLTPTGTK